MNCVPVDLFSDSITLYGKARKAIVVFVWVSHNAKGIGDIDTMRSTMVLLPTAYVVRGKVMFWHVSV